MAPRAVAGSPLNDALMRFGENKFLSQINADGRSLFYEETLLGTDRFSAVPMELNRMFQSWDR